MMVLVHLSVNGKSALIDPSNILFAEECEGQDSEKKPIAFTRLYLRQPLPGEDGSISVDIKEDVGKLLKAIR